MRTAESQESDCSKPGQLLFLVFNLRAAPYDNFPSFLNFKIKKQVPIVSMFVSVVLWIYRCIALHCKSIEMVFENI